MIRHPVTGFLGRGNFCTRRRLRGRPERDCHAARIIAVSPALSSLAPVAIGSCALDILAVLIARAGGVVSKDEIIAAVWPGTVVEDSNLTVQVSALRRVLDQRRTPGSCISDGFRPRLSLRLCR